ncbi:hypothetical protein [Mariniblastus fucicola]|nr:hypothetical protein [Mariniblastus fucicola]
MKNVLTFSLLAVATLFVSSVGAQEEAKKCEKCTANATSTVATTAPATQCSGEECAKGCCNGCPVTAAMAKLPKMTYRVGTEDLGCAESAAKLAKEKEAKLHFVVGKEVFEDKTEAYTSLVEQTESMVNEFVTPKTCSVSGTHTVAGKSCKCPVEAGKTAELVKTAIKDVKMTYAVGEKTCSCPNEAGSIAKTTGKEMTYVIGEEKTSCNMTARLTLAKAKYKAAVTAMVAAEKATAEASKTAAPAKEEAGT